MKKKPTPEVAFSNVEKVFFPEVGFTKGEIIKYYLEIAPALLPHVRDRAVTLIRYPDGVHGEKFFEKNAPGYAPDWIRTTPVEKIDGGILNYIVIDDAPTLAWCANNAAVELHPFLHRADDITRPTHIAFDLDPGEGADLLSCIEVGLLMQAVLEQSGLEAYPKVSGSKGLQLYVPLNTPTHYDATRRFAHALADALARQHPELVVSDMSKALRRNKVFIDWSQNHDKKTTVSAYSLRGKRAEPFVSLPVSWAELRRARKTRDLASLYFSPAAALKRFDKLGDLFAPVLKQKQTLPAEFAIGRTKPSRVRPRKSRHAATPTAAAAPLPSRSAQGSRRRFVVLKFAGRSSHYDLRLETNGALKSWVVPKGMPFAKGEKRSGFIAPDRSLEDLSFEGVIADGPNAGAAVMAWDIGTFDTIEGSFWKGTWRVFLSGKKLEGEWTLTRTGEASEARWSIEKTGAAAKPPRKNVAAVSALSGTTFEALQKEDPPQRSEKSSAPRTRTRRKASSRIPEPEFVDPMAARETEDLPTEGDWIYEIKWDGYRVLGMKHGDVVRLLSRKNNDLTKDFPGVAAALKTMRAHTALVDGEIVALDENGRPSFQELQHRARTRAAIVCYAYDLLNLEGEDLRKQPLHARKEKLRQILEGSGVLFSASLPGAPAAIVANVKKLGLEGVVIKRADSRYEAGERSGSWLKLKFSPEQEFVVGGYKRGKPLESLVVGYYADGKLLCAGKVRQGLNARNRAELAERLRPLQSDVCPFANLPNSKKNHWGEGITADQMKNHQWVMPKVVVQASFAEWTRGGSLRHATFKGVREDKSPAEVVREL